MIIIFAVALCARAAFLFGGGRLTAPLEYDEVCYDNYAQNLVDGKGYTQNGVTPSSFWPPGYPVFLAGIYAVFGHSPAAALVIQAALDLAGILLAFSLARRYFGPRPALIAAGLCAVYPYFIYRAGHLLTETLAVFLTLLAVYLATLARERGDTRYWLLTGAAAGFLALTKAAFQLLPVVFVIWFLIAFVRRRQVALKLAACVGVMVLVVAPYVVRNAILQGRFVGVATEGGVTFYGAHNEHTLNEAEFTGFWVNPLRFGVADPLTAGGKEAELSDAMYKKGWAAIAANPGKMPMHLLNKLSNMWFIHFYYFERESLSLKIMRLSFAGLMPLFLVGLFAKSPGKTRLVMPQLLCAMFTLIALVFYGNARLRAPIDPFVLMFAAWGAVAAWRMLASRPPVRERARALSTAYIMSQFPQTYETFILREINELASRGADITIFSLKSCRDKVIHEDARPYLARTVYSPFIFSSRLLAANLFFILRHPGRYLRALWYIVSRCGAKPVYMIKILAVFPKTACFAFHIQQKGLTHVHAHWASIPGDAAAIISILTGARFSITAHAYDIYTTNPSLAEKVRRADFVVTCTSYNVAHLVSLLPFEERGKVHLNYHGLDAGKFRFCERRQQIHKRILAVGRLTETKGYPYLIEAVHLLRMRGVDCRCDIVGDGEMRHEVEARIRRRGLQDVVTLHGVISQPKLVELMLNANVLVMASVVARNNDRDGIPNVILEAMASGLPVIASEVSGIPEVVIDGETGLLVPEGDAVALEKAIAGVFEDPGRAAQMAMRARKKIERDFDIDENVGALMNLFETEIREIDHAQETCTIRS
jgi:glycosyltransferase involved in cell wall biosynthesis